jgi:hypothetical protein
MGKFNTTADGEHRGSVHYEFDDAGGEGHVMVEFACDGGPPEIEIDKALAVLIAEGVVIVNSNWWREDFTDEQKKAVSVSVNCSDVFAWGGADAEDLPYGEIGNVYRLWRRDPVWGAAVWCTVRRNRPPQDPAARADRGGGRLGPRFAGPGGGENGRTSRRRREGIGGTGRKTETGIITRIVKTRAMIIPKSIGRKLFRRHELYYRTEKHGQNRFDGYKVS